MKHNIGVYLFFHSLSIGFFVPDSFYLNKHPLRISVYVNQSMKMGRIAIILLQNNMSWTEMGTQISYSDFCLYCCLFTYVFLSAFH